MPNAVEPPSTSPASLAEAYELLADADGVPWRPLAGGTDLMVTITGEIGEPPARVLDIWRIDELRGIRDEGDALMIGALTTYTDLRRSPDVARLLPVLAEAAATIGAAQIQNRGTIGGNVVNASPAGDTLPVLLALDAEVVLGSVRGERTVAATDFWPAYRETARRNDELVVSIRVPLATDPSASLTSVHGASSPVDRHASAMTTLLIAWARRVPILRNRTSRSAASGTRMRRTSSSSRRAVAR